MKYIIYLIKLLLSERQYQKFKKNIKMPPRTLYKECVWI